MEGGREGVIRDAAGGGGGGKGEDEGRVGGVG